MLFVCQKTFYLLREKLKNLKYTARVKCDALLAMNVMFDMHIFVLTNIVLSRATHASIVRAHPVYSCIHCTRASMVLVHPLYSYDIKNGCKSCKSNLPSRFLSRLIPCEFYSLQKCFSKKIQPKIAFMYLNK